MDWFYSMEVIRDSLYWSALLTEMVRQLKPWILVIRGDQDPL